MDLLSDFDPDGAISQLINFCFEMQRQSEEEWKSTFVESKKRSQSDLSPDELAFVKLILGLLFCKWC